ncbi:MAG: helix-turn-helix transcriptional regulator, partial [Cytophagales bacterium]
MIQKKSPAQKAGLDHSSRLNLTLVGCSSAEPTSVSVQRCKIQFTNLYLQPVKIPSHLPPYLRYRIIHSCLSSKQHRYWSLQQLVDRLEVHDLAVDKRSVERDLEAMRHDERLGYHAPIAYDRKEKGYHYTNPQFSIDQLPLTEEDLEALSLAANILHQYKGAKVVQQFEGMVDKLSQRVQHLRQPHGKLIAFEKTPYYKGQLFFDAMVKAITARQVLAITYQKFNLSEPHEHIFHPYFLKEYLGRWYVLGHSEARGHLITLGLERIEKMTPLALPFKENKNLKPKEYFQHTLGITLGTGPVEDVELWFSKTLAPYLKTQHIHHS